MSFLLSRNIDRSSHRHNDPIFLVQAQDKGDCRNHDVCDPCLDVAFWGPERQTPKRRNADAG